MNGSPITIKEFKEAKRPVEAAIADMLTEFYQETNVPMFVEISKQYEAGEMFYGVHIKGSI